MDGPGTYTRSSRTYPGNVRMPDFELSTPIGFEWLQNLLRVCSTGEFQEVRSTKASDLSDCTYTLSTSPGRFELSCSASDSTTRLGGTVNPSFQLASDCDVVMR